MKTERNFIKHHSQKKIKNICLSKGRLKTYRHFQTAFLKNNYSLSFSHKTTVFNKQ